jgi:hypothetical protein
MCVHNACLFSDKGQLSAINMTPLSSLQVNVNKDSDQCDTIHVNYNSDNVDNPFDHTDICINIVDCVLPSPVDNYYNADVIVNLLDDGVVTRDVISSYDVDSMYIDSYGNFQFCDLNHLFNCSISNCKYCLFIRHSFQFIHSLSHRFYSVRSVHIW